MDTSLYEVMWKGMVDMIYMAGYGGRLLDVVGVGGYQVILEIRMGMHRYA